MSRWACAGCGHDNAVTLLVCDWCGQAQRFSLDPPLDLPFPPAATQTAAFAPFVVWAALAVAGVVLLIYPSLREAVGVSTIFVALEAVLAMLAALSAYTAMRWQQLFYEVRFDVPATVRTGESFEATLRLIPYRQVSRLEVRIELVDQFYQSDRSGRTVRRSLRLDSRSVAVAEALSGRREHNISSTFLGPLPVNKRSDALSEMQASLLALLSPLVPAFGHIARNLREHGGYFVRARVRVGLLQRVFERRVVAYHLGRSILVG